jgi:CopG antitoxin of type II toxin-antitoxin system
MRQPSLSRLKIDTAGTAKIRAELAKKKSIKITINIDAESLVALKEIARETGMPYQRLLNALLKDSLKKRETTESRLARLEQELKKMKRKLAA